MSSGINRLHGRTFLQKDLCYEVFHRGYENSVFNTTYNFNGGNICGGGFWGGFAGGMGMGLGAGLMGMLGNWMGGFGNMFGGFGNMFGGFPMFGNFGCFGGGFPMMNWWGGGAGGSSTSSASVTGGSTTHNHYSNTTVKEKENKDLKKLDDLENKINKLEEKLKNNKKVSQKDFNKIYVKTFGYTLRDNEDTDADNKRVESFKARLNNIAEEHGYNKPEVEKAKEQENVPAAKQKQAQIKAEEIVTPPLQVIKTNQPEDENDFELNDGSIGKFIALYVEASSLGNAEKLGVFENKFRNYIQGKSKQNLENLLGIEGIAGTELENILRESIAALEAAEKTKKPQEPDVPEVVKQNFAGLNLSSEDMLTLNGIGKMDTIDGIRCFVPSKSKITLDGIKILEDNEIPVAFANNKKAEIDQWVIGNVKDTKVNKKGDDYDEYTINCQGFGKFGLEFKVRKISNQKYNITCTSKSNDSEYDHLYAADNGCTYNLEDTNGVLNFDKNNIVDTLISRYKKSGYTEIPKPKK